MTVTIHTARNLLAFLLLIGLAARLFLIWHLPFTFDEGAYLYDARTLAAGALPGGDVLAKSPVMALLLAAIIKLIGPHLFIARAVSLLANMGTAIALYTVGRRLQNQRLGLAVAILWLFASAPLALTIYGTTHAVALALATTAAAFWLASLQHSSSKTAFLAGTCFVLAYATRKTMLATAAPLVLLWFIYHRPRRLVLAAGIGAVLTLLPWLTSMHLWYGWAGITEAMGWGYSQIAEQYISEPASMVSWGGGWARFGRVAIQLITPLALLIAWNVRRRLASLPLAASIVWLMAMLGLYSLWPGLLPQYLADLMPALVLLSALGLGYVVKQPRPIAAAVISLTIITNFLSLWLVYSQPWAADYTRADLQAASQQLAVLVPEDEPILTAAVIVPYLSGHRVYADIAHPLWYRYNFVNAAAQQAFLPPREDIKQALVNGEVQWVLADRLTNYTYFSRFLPHPATQPIHWSAHPIGPFQLYSVLK